MSGKLIAMKARAFDLFVQKLDGEPDELLNKALLEAGFASDNSDFHGAHNIGRTVEWLGTEGTTLDYVVVAWAQEGAQESPHYRAAPLGKGGAHSIFLSDFEKGWARWKRRHDRHCDGFPCECGANPPPKLPVWEEFHECWSQAKESPEYEKKRWMKLQRIVQGLVYDARDKS